MERINVIFNYQTWLPLTENWIYNQARHLPPSIVPFVVCGTTSNRDHFAVDNLFSYSDLARPRRLGVLLSAAALGVDLTRKNALIADVARRCGVSLVHSHFGYTGFHAARAVKKIGLKHVVTFYGVDMSALPKSDTRWMSRYRSMFSMVDKVLCEGPTMARGLIALGCPPEKLEVHHLGVQVDELPFQPRTWTPGEPLRVLIAASFREKKGIPVAMEALGLIQRDVPLEITVIGDAGNSAKSRAEKRKIHDAVARCRLAERVTFMGYQPFSVLLDQAYQHHIFMSPSITASDGDTEGGLPVALIEMAATGMPVVSTRHADIPELIVDGVNGMLADERDIGGLVQRLHCLIRSPDRWIDLSSRARKTIERDFNAAHQGERLASIYRCLLASDA